MEDVGEKPTKKAKKDEDDDSKPDLSKQKLIKDSSSSVSFSEWSFTVPVEEKNDGTT
jgi:hypothetical protein